jgi:hypothetical protein
MDIIQTFSNYFQPYLSVKGIRIDQSYNYAARGMFDLPIFDLAMHRSKTPKGAWTYLAVPAGSSLSALKENERLYVGCQTSDRMFRGDFDKELRGKNFHHHQMRTGRNGDNAETYLKSGMRFDIFVLDAQSLLLKIANDSSLSHLTELMSQLGNHPGYWLEQFILATQSGRWRWNQKGAESGVLSFLMKRGFVA